MTPEEYRRLDGVALAELVRRREVTPAELAGAAQAVIEAENPAINAVVRRHDPGPQLGSLDTAAPLAGVPFLLKDIGAHCAGLPTTGGNRYLAAVIPPAAEDDAWVARAKSAGLVVLGQTNTPDLGMNVATEPVLHGTTRNPLDHARSPGGSSGGAAAAVAAGMVPIAHATDGAGSIRVPAACCGLVGLKTSRGLMPEGPEASHVYQGLVAAFVVSRTVRDSLAALKALHGADAGAPYAAPTLTFAGRPPKRLRIAIDCTAPAGMPVEPAAIAAALAVGRRLAELGHDVDQTTLPLDDDERRLPGRMYGAQARVQTAVMVEGLARLHGREPTEADFEPVLWAALQEGRAMPAATLVDLEHRMHALTRKLAPFFAAWDVLLSPATRGIAWPLGSLPTDHHDVALHIDRMTAHAPFSALWNVTGLPALVIPSGEHAEGMPLGVQLVGRHGADALLLELAATLLE